MSGKRVLYVDDEAPIRRAVHTWLSRRGHTVHVAADVAGAQRIIESEQLDGAFVDLFLAGESGLALHAWMREHRPDLARHTTFVSGEASPTGEVGRLVREHGAGVLAKPFDLKELESIVAAWS